MAVLLGLAAALGFGGGDFLGGLASKRSPAAAVLVVVQATGLVIAIGWVAAAGNPFPAGDDVVIALFAGVFGVTGLALLFRGLATGRMGVVAPVSAVIASVLPVAWGLFEGERPTWVAGIGVAVSIAAVALISREPDRDPDGDELRVSPLLLGFTAGAAFGVAVILFSEAAQEAGFWPLIFSRIGAFPVLVVTAAATQRRYLPRRGDVRTSLLSGVLDVAGNGALLVAFRRGLTSLVSPIAALYPATTVILARIVLTEPITRPQSVGLALAVVGLVLIGVGQG